MRDVLSTNWREAIELETQVAKIIHKQETHGFLFDKQLGLKYVNDLEQKIANIDSELGPRMPNHQIRDGDILHPFKRDGTPLLRATKYLGFDPVGPFSKVYWEPMNLNSDVQLKDYFLSIGWKPTEYNFKYDERGKKVQTSPKITEESLESLQQGLGKTIADRLTTTHRLSQLNGLIALVRADGRISSRANTIGTPTGRFRHIGVVNLPRPSTYFGTEIRSLFIAPEGYKLVDVDAKGLEMRVLCHYMNDAAFTLEILQGDIHTENFKVLEDLVESRSVCKNLLYALLYGAQDYKLGQTAEYEGDKKKVECIGAEIRQRIMRRLPALEALSEGVQKAAERRGYLLGIDKRKIYIRAIHAALNSLFQCCGAVLMKKAMVLKEEYKLRERLSSVQVSHQHDESVDETRDDEVEATGKCALDSIRDAGLHFNLNVNLEGDFHYGQNWSVVH